MRILWLTERVTGHDRRFTALLAGAGHEVHYLALSVPDELPPPKLPPGVVWVSWGERPVADVLTPASAVAMLLALRQVLERVRPDVVHAGPVPTGGLLAALAGVRPLVVMSWGSDVLVDAERGPEWAQATESALRAADRFVCDCDAVLDRARRFAPIPDAAVIQLPWGTDPVRFAPAAGPAALRGRIGAGPLDFVVLCTRSWEPIYAIDTLLEGFRRARDVEPALRLVLLGGGTLAPDVHRWIDEAGLCDAVHLPGPVSHDVLPDWFRSADLYASCARSDGTSVSLLEAMATGLPVLVTDIPSNREWVVPGENGWLAAPRDPASVADALVQASRLGLDERTAMGRRNRRIVEERADWKRNGQLLLDAYVRLLP
jgi:glycosyltransferase involved in cell wall biosynthesis